ncbi:MAG: hypothetical protein ACYTXF_32025 [Nostoc sp.]
MSATRTCVRRSSSLRTGFQSDRLRRAGTPSHNPIAKGRNQVSGGISRLVCTP